MRRCLVINRRFALALITLIVVAAASIGCAGDRDDTLTFNMAWLPQGSMSGVLVAIDQGYYEEVGLNVEAVRGFGGIRTVNEIDQGLFDFGYGDPLAVVLNRNNGGRTKMIGAINSRWPSGLCFITERHQIEEPEDLKGLVLAGGQNSPMQFLVPAWLERNGVDRDEVELMQLQPSVVTTSLVEGTVDAAECWLGNSMAIFETRAREAGVTLDWIEYGKFNLDIYGNGLVTSEKMLLENPETVRRFVEATYRGYAYSKEHADEAASIVSRLYPVLDPDITRQQVEEMADLLGDGRLGWMEEDKVARTLDFLIEAYDIEASITPRDIFTTEFIP